MQFDSDVWCAFHMCLVSLFNKSSYWQQLILLEFCQFMKRQFNLFLKACKYYWFIWYTNNMILFSIHIVECHITYLPKGLLIYQNEPYLLDSESSKKFIWEFFFWYLLLKSNTKIWSSNIRRYLRENSDTRKTGSLTVFLLIWIHM